MVRDALVSLWRSPGSTLADQFACSGFFIAPRRIVTARHVLYDENHKKHEKLWARVQVDAANSYEIRAAQEHLELDVALLEIESMPAGGLCLSPNLDSAPQAKLRLHGYFEAGLEEGSDYIAHNFDNANRHYRIEPKQPPGHSGSALCVGDRVWGMTVRQYADPNIPRGCALGLHQFWPWLIQLVPELAQIQAPPQWDDWVEQARKGMAKSFKRPVFDKFENVFERHPSGLPVSLGEALADLAPASVGENCVEALIALVKESHAAIVDGAPSLAVNECKAAREGFLSAMGSASRLCLDPAQLHAQGIDPNGKLASILDVRASTVPGAGVAMRPAPHHSWEYVDGPGLRSLKDRHALELSLELGEGDACKKALALAAFKSLAGPLAAPERIENELPSIHGFATSEAREGRARILVFCGAMRPDRRDELQTWVATHLGVNLLILNPPAGEAAKLYLFAEHLLLARIGVFLRLLYSSEWSLP